MNKKSFKLIALLLVLIFLINIIFPITVFGTEQEDIPGRSNKREEKDIKPSDEFFDNNLFGGLTKLKQDMEPEPASAGESALMLIPNLLVSLGKIFAKAFDFVFNLMVTERITDYPGTETADYINDEKYTKVFTLDKLFFGDVELLDANFFSDNGDPTHLNTIIKTNVAKWYIIMAGIALISLLGIMIYLAINMVLVYSGLRTPQKHATIKETMVNIAISFAMVFLLPVVLSIIANFNGVLVKMFNGVRVGLVNSFAEDNFEMFVRSGSWVSGGFNTLIINISYIMLIVVYLRFMMVYLKRFYTLGFLTIIAPLMAVTYSVDKLKDDKSQVLGKFYREYFFAYFLQPLHCFMYLLYLGALGAIATVSPIMGLFLLSLFGRVEKIIKGAFDSRDLMVIRSSEEFIKGGQIN